MTVFPWKTSERCCSSCDATCMPLKKFNPEHFCKLVVLLQEFIVIAIVIVILRKLYFH